MKKVTSLLISLIMAFSISTSAFADYVKGDAVVTTPLVRDSSITVFATPDGSWSATVGVFILKLGYLSDIRLGKTVTGQVYCDVTKEVSLSKNNWSLNSYNSEDLVEVSGNVTETKVYNVTFEAYEYETGIDGSKLDTIRITVHPAHLDTIPPQITPPPDITKEATGELTPVQLGEAIATDAAGIRSVTSNVPSEGFPCGETLVTWTAVDKTGHISTAVQKVTIIDAAPPLVTVPPDITIEAKGEFTKFELPSPKATDFSGIKSVTSNAPSDGFSYGDTVVTWTAEDNSGKTSSVEQKVTVIDTTAPVITAPPAISKEATGFTTPISPEELGIGVASDIFDVTITNDAPALFPLGTTEVTWTATDAKGNTSTAVQKVTIIDAAPPLVTVPPDITIEAKGEFTKFELPSPKATDFSGIKSVTSNAPSDGFSYGDTVVTWTAEDNSGKTSSVEQKVTVVDTTAPVITAPPAVSKEATGFTTPISPEELGIGMASDIFDVTITNDAPALFPLGTTEVTWTATDAKGNTSTASQLVTITDTTVPDFKAPEDIVMEASGEKTFLKNEIFGSVAATDIFDIEPIECVVPEEGFALGETLVTWIARDKNGNTKTAFQKVTIADTTAPKFTVSPKDITAVVSETSKTVDLGTVFAEDIFGVTLTNNAPAEFPLGETIVQWTATDGNGNRAIAEQKVTVYKFSDVLQPVNPIRIDQDSKTARISLFKQGSTVPVKFTLLDKDGNKVNPLGATLSLKEFNGEFSINSEFISAYSTNFASMGNMFRYDSYEGQYIFNLSTKPLKTGTYIIRIKFGNEQYFDYFISFK